MKKYLLLAGGLLLASLSQAQTLFEAFKPGTYLLADSRRQRYQGRLKVHTEELVVKDEQGKVTRFKPEEVYYVRMADNKRYMPASSFQLNARTIKPSLVEVLDSGQVMLLHYDKQANGAPMVSANGTMHGSTGSATILYLLQRPDDTQPIPLPTEGLSGKKFRDALLPYVQGRPDLAKLLAEKQISTANLPDFIHALNSGQPMTLSLAPTVY